MNCNTSVLTGMTKEQLQAALASAQKAYVDLMTGAKAVTLSYTQGDGARSVTYQQTNQQQLVAFIQLLQQALGLSMRARRPIRFNFR
ncbi:gpW family head-tail joining protein [uncultured Pseudacidovorax sp.]|uniref:gpW family head-tail joining protein n=1 Tax=uncultured Pseudacidovorax sp. TaxID=679313 RepID=UPI0025E16135|nr:gpW family head-tail joining protein [uncultured Pseudacidovorax sp.]